MARLGLEYSFMINKFSGDIDSLEICELDLKFISIRFFSFQKRQTNVEYLLQMEMKEFLGWFGTEKGWNRKTDATFLGQVERDVKGKNQ